MNHVLLYNEELTIKEVVKALDESGIGLVSFVDSENNLVGILTDGDLRRGILNNLENVKDLINFEPIKMASTSSKSEVIASLKYLHRRHMPLVDDNNKFISIFSLDDIDFVSRPNTVVIMAGGLGSRLGKLTKDTPKPMLHVGEQPMLLHLVEQFREQGFRKFILCLNYKKELIQEYFGDGSKFSVDIEYIVEEKRMGTAGALSLIKNKFEQPFFVVNADVLTNLSFDELLDYHIDKDALATMAVREYCHEVPFGVIKKQGGKIIGIEEKPSISFDVNAGIYVLSPKTIEMIPEDQFYDMPSLFKKMASNGDDCHCFQIRGYWIDIGRKEELVKANSDLRKGL
ncbi:nucleotidyltransferase family protein [Vibrio pectenicida]|uniref:CBS domain-containing protein n=1 Tax=Vibrio pectenicida TaxID=62763 RepID=A0A3R9EB52_9VIBR|nr:nucleotidyltransferase family protein [Vibrio pectenicida]RSD27913.1 CBS domain-containing protein [Vibrio pectenicida]